MTSHFSITGGCANSSASFSTSAAASLPEISEAQATAKGAAAGSSMGAADDPLIDNNILIWWKSQYPSKIKEALVRATLKEINNKISTLTIVEKYVP